jgi:hypothetical protein
LLAAEKALETKLNTLHASLSTLEISRQQAQRFMPPYSLAATNNTADLWLSGFITDFHFNQRGEFWEGLIKEQQSGESIYLRFIR